MNWHALSGFIDNRHKIFTFAGFKNLSMHHIWHAATEVFGQTLIITAFVMTMMLIIEYINVQTHGNWSKPFQKSVFLQILFGSFIGLIPGCIGAFTVVSLYTHGILNFAALTAAMISTMGDEAFVMFSVIPETAFYLSVSVFFIALAVGGIVYFFTKNKQFIKNNKNHFQIHAGQDHCYCYHTSDIRKHLKNISFERALLITGLSLFIVLLLTGFVGHAHKEAGHELHDHAGIFADWGWENWFLLGSTLISLFIVATVPDHFLDHHLWDHVIKKHLSKIFFWTIGTLFAIHFLTEYIDVSQWVKDNQITILVLAILIGWIPESGPNLIFLNLFVAGATPLSVLLANSIIQDGHGMLPMLAESKKSYLYVKLINSAVAFIFGMAGFWMGW